MYTTMSIKYQDALVRILAPTEKKGVLLFSRYQCPDIKKTGIKSGQQLKKEGIDINRSVFHPHIFFRAPYYSREIDYTSVETEIASSYGELIDPDHCAFIRVDPDHTYVFSSELRSAYMGDENLKHLLQESKKTLTEYLRIIAENEKVKPSNTTKVVYHMLSSRAMVMPEKRNPPQFVSPYPINRTSEVLVSIPHLTLDYYVKI